jgi:uncharacterized membrane protein YqgA involved in biofilm formation
VNGTILNVAAILVCGLFTLFTRKQLSTRVQLWFKLIIGPGTAFFGLRLVWDSVSGQPLAVAKQLGIVAIALILGRLTGRLLRLQKLSNALGRFASDGIERAAKGGPTRFGDGFSVCAALFCAAPLAMLGAIQDGLSGYYHPLVVKSLMDGLATMAFVPAFRWGAVASAVPVLAWQGTIALLAHAAAPWLEHLGLLASINATGGLLVSFVALVILGVTRVEMADYLPSLLWAPLLTWLWR